MAGQGRSTLNHCYLLGLNAIMEEGMKLRFGDVAVGNIFDLHW
jgi:hypothetical protein